ncbi:MAG: hypothetical protein IKT27_03570 [Clostridia bacterium]|nr:hypothetical protein [Clostridia bacterium]
MIVRIVTFLDDTGYRLDVAGVLNEIKQEYHSNKYATNLPGNPFKDTITVGNTVVRLDAIETLQIAGDDTDYTFNEENSNRVSHIQSILLSKLMGKHYGW